MFNNLGGTITDFIDTTEIPPIIAFNSSWDTTLPKDIWEMRCSDSRVICNLLDFNNICFGLNVEPSGDHGSYNSVSETEFRVGGASCFFKRIMCDNCTDFNATTGINANYSIYFKSLVLNLFVTN